MEQLKQAGTKVEVEIADTAASPVFTALNDVGYKPQWVLFGQQLYFSDSVKAAKAFGTFPPTYTNLTHLPLDVADQFPVMQQVKGIMAAGGPADTRLDAFTLQGFSSWTLWAQSASECGTKLTQDCVLRKAGARTGWDAGGLFSSLTKLLSEPQLSDCWLLERLTAKGWVYDKTVMQPNTGPFACDSENLTTVKSCLGS